MTITAAASRFAFAATLLGGAVAAAQDDPPSRPPVDDLEVTAFAGVWIPRLDGVAGLGPSGSLDLDDDLDLHDMEPTFNVELAIRKDEAWQIILGGADFSTDAAGLFPTSATFGSLNLSAGDQFRSTFELTTISAEVAAETWRPLTRDPGPDNRNADGRYTADLRFGPAFVVRWVDADHTVEQTGVGTETAGGEWLGLLGGFELTLDWRPENVPLMTMVRWYAGLALGPAIGGDEGLMWQVRGGLVLHVTETFGVMVGYRLLELDVDSDGYALDGGLQGLFLSGSIRF